MQQLELVSIDGVRLEAALHAAPGTYYGGTVIQAHGITADMDEWGMFVQLAERLQEAGVTVLRFSFRGHGGSGGTQRGVTIAGEMLDLQAAVEYAVTKFRPPLSIVASSFGAVPVILSLPWLDERLERLVFWNPVLDLRRTFVEPELPWGTGNYSPAQQGLLSSQGFLMVDGRFELGRVMFEEFRCCRPVEHFLASAVPVLVVHGDQDTAVSYEIARQCVGLRPSCALHTVVGSGHGFDSRERKDEALRVTADWLTRQQAKQSWLPT
jgi:alpha-beta hydrolase superfamily lysophospholipase